MKVAVHDDLTLSKLSFFSYIASLMEPYSRKYQCDKPLLIFMLKDLQDGFGLARAIVKEIVIDGKIVKQLMEVGLDKSENILSLKKMNFGFATDALLKELRKKDAVTAKQFKEFREEAGMFVVATLRKLIKKSPLSSSFICLAAIFNPVTISQESSGKSIVKGFKRLLKLFLDYNILSVFQYDRAAQEFQIFMDEDMKTKQVVLTSFDKETIRLDHFYFKVVMIGRYEMLSFILKIIFCLSWMCMCGARI